MAKQRWWSVLAFAILLCLPAPLAAQLDIPSMVPKMQALLKNVSCPSSASVKSCASFRALVQSGSPELTAQFASAFFDPKVHLYLIYVVFENNMDDFWVISSDVVHTDKGLLMDMASYGEYQGGHMVTGAVSGDVPFVYNGPTTWSSAKDGVTVSYFETGNTSMLSNETWKNNNGETMSIAISVDKTDPADTPQAPVTITLQSPTNKVVDTGTALKFFNASVPVQ